MEKDLFLRCESVGRSTCGTPVPAAENGSSCPSGCRGYEGCGEDSWGLNDYPLAMVYAPCQSFRALYDPNTALARGTLFTELDLPLGDEKGAFCTLTPIKRCCSRDKD